MASEENSFQIEVLELLGLLVWDNGIIGFFKFSNSGKVILLKLVEALVKEHGLLRQHFFHIVLTGQFS